MDYQISSEHPRTGSKPQTDSGAQLAVEGLTERATANLSLLYKGSAPSRVDLATLALIGTAGGNPARLSAAQ